MKLSTIRLCWDTEGIFKYTEHAQGWKFRTLHDDANQIIKEAGLIDKLEGWSCKNYHSRKEAHDDIKSAYQAKNIKPPSDKFKCFNTYYYKKYPNVSIFKEKEGWKVVGKIQATCPKNIGWKILDQIVSIDIRDYIDASFSTRSEALYALEVSAKHIQENKL